MLNQMKQYPNQIIDDQGEVWKLVSVDMTGVANYANGIRRIHIAPWQIK